MRKGKFTICTRWTRRKYHANYILYFENWVTRWEIMDFSLPWSLSLPVCLFSSYSLHLGHSQSACSSSPPLIPFRSFYTPKDPIARSWSRFIWIHIFFESSMIPIHSFTTPISIVLHMNQPRGQCVCVWFCSEPKTNLFCDCLICRMMQKIKKNIVEIVRSQRFFFALPSIIFYLISCFHESISCNMCNMCFFDFCFSFWNQCVFIQPELNAIPFQFKNMFSMKRSPQLIFHVFWFHLWFIWNIMSLYPTWPQNPLFCLADNVCVEFFFVGYIFIFICFCS